MSLSGTNQLRLYPEASTLYERLRKVVFSPRVNDSFGSLYKSKIYT